LIYPTLLILIFFGYKDKEKTKRKSKNYALWNQVPEESAERSSMRPGKWEGWINHKSSNALGGAKFSKKVITFCLLKKQTYLHF
jgi:hypothetical protein